MKIRVADKKDAALIADLSRQTFADSFAGQNKEADIQKFFDEQFTREALIAEVGAPNNIFFLVEEGKEVLGYTRLRENNQPPELGSNNSIEIARLYAVKDAIGKGVGKLMMQYALDTARQLGKDVAWLGVWEHNQRAIDFYIKWGFEKFSSHIFLLGDDKQTDFLMKKSLR
jgi:ribosomal protein S18 acetylase RimI-like enzyme